ncbi:MAG: hypothetical protein RQ862_11570 [Candidatus Caldarchaeales archaeon]|nr:hypothetical protein [Candidatus Caldarchaeales archaeon]
MPAPEGAGNQQAAVVAELRCERWASCYYSAEQIAKKEKSAPTTRKVNALPRRGRATDRYQSSPSSSSRISAWRDPIPSWRLPSRRFGPRP